MRLQPWGTALPYAAAAVGHCSAIYSYRCGALSLCCLRQLLERGAPALCTCSCGEQQISIHSSPSPPPSLTSVALQLRFRFCTRLFLMQLQLWGVVPLRLIQLQLWGMLTLLSAVGLGHIRVCLIALPL